MIGSTSYQWKNIRRIGLFDSGVGGLSVLRSLVDRVSSADEKEFVYIGDALRCPYGDRPAKQISTYVKQLSNWLLQQQIDAIVMACNTSAAVSKEEVLNNCPVPVFDLLESTANFVSQRGIGKVGVMATNSTASRKAFTKAIQNVDSSIQVTEIGCPLLVPVVEAGLTEAPDAQDALRPYVTELLNQEVDAIIYGCTHYPFLSSALHQLMSTMTANAPLTIDPADCLANVLSGYSVGGNANNADAYSNTRFVTTGDAEKFARLGSRCLKQNIGPVGTVTLTELRAAGVWRKMVQTAQTIVPAASSSPVIQFSPEAAS